MSLLSRLTRRLFGDAPGAAARLAAPAQEATDTRGPMEVLFDRAQAALRGEGARAYARGQALEDAQLLVASGETALARTLLTEALSEHPGADLRQLLVKVLVMRGERAPATQLLRALALEPSHAHAAEVELGQLFEDANDLEAARRHYERALALQPGPGLARERARRLRARMEGERGLPPDAWRTMSRLWGETAAGDRYSVMEEVGRGGAATLFKATESSTGRLVALKVFHPRGDPLVRAQRIRREAAVSARFDTPWVVPVLDVIPERDLMVMPFYDGGSLKGRLSQGPLPDLTALMLCLEVARALRFIHAEGVAHLDLKPSNLLLVADRPVLADFGAAGAAELGQVAGTPPYMAPELLQTGVADTRADLFALGVVLLECLTGLPGTDPAALLADGKPARRGAGLLVVELLKEDPAQRPQPAAAVVEALGALVHLATVDGT
jgi:hypothetical protein